MHAEIVLPIRMHHLGMTQIEKDDRTTNGTNIDRLPKPIQHENLTV